MKTHASCACATKDPESGEVIEVAQKSMKSEEVQRAFDRRSPRISLAAAVAEYAEILRKSLLGQRKRR